MIQCLGILFTIFRKDEKEWIFRYLIRIFRPNIPYSNASTDIATLEATIGNNLNAATSPLTVPYPIMPPLSFMQQLAFPFPLDITSAAIAHPDTSAAAAVAAATAAIFNIAAAANVTTHTAMLRHTTPTAAFDPYAAAQMAAAASQLLQEQHELQQQVMQQLQANNCNLNNTINGYHQNEVLYTDH